MKLKNRILNFVIEQFVSIIICIRDNGHFPIRYIITLLVIINRIIRLTITRHILYGSLLGLIIMMIVHTIIVALTLTNLVNNDIKMKKIGDLIKKYRVDDDQKLLKNKLLKQLKFKSIYPLYLKKNCFRKKTIKNSKYLYKLKCNNYKKQQNLI